MGNAYSDFLKRLIEYRNSLCMTQKQVASQFNISQGQYSKLESGEIRMSNQVLNRMREDGWDIRYILDGKRQPDGFGKLYEICHADKTVRETEILRLLAWCLESVAQNAVLPQEMLSELRLLKLRLQEDSSESVLYLCRKLLEKSQEQMAMQLGLGIKTYRKYEQNQREMSVDMVMQLSALTKCRSTVLLFSEYMEWNLIQYIWSGLPPVVQECVQKMTEEGIRFLQCLNRNAG